jgi:uncharacterized protein (TIGR02271 family)
MNEPMRGMAVTGPSGQLGTVHDVIYETHGEAARIIVQRDDGQTMVVQPGAYRVENGCLLLGVGQGGFERELSAESATDRPPADLFRTQQVDQTVAAQALDVQPGETRVIPVIQEELDVTLRQVERGGVRVNKRVEEREELVEQPTFREEVSVERVAIGRPIDQEIGPYKEGDTLIIPVLEEMLVVEKRLVLKEEIRVTKRRIDEIEQARVVLREEHVDIEDLDSSEPLA